MFREGKGGRKRRETLVREGNIDSGLSYRSDLDQTLSPDLCPDQESKRRPFTLWDSTQHTEPHRSRRAMSIDLHCVELHITKTPEGVVVVFLSSSACIFSSSALHGVMGHPSNPRDGQLSAARPYSCLTVVLDFWSEDS